MDGVIDELVHGARVAEAYFDLGRVHVHIHAEGVEFEEQHIGRVAAAVEDVGVGFANGVGDEFVAHEAAIDVEELGVAAAARVGRQRGKAGEAEQAGFGFDAAGRGEEIVAQQGAHTGFELLQ